MILYARCENYRSIGGKQTISFVANSDKSHNDILIEEDNLNVLPVIPLYGGNATGKTNILKFLKTLIEIVTGKIDIEHAYDPCKFYPEKKESTFEVIFLEDKIKYYYKISYTNNSILEEALYYYPNGKISKIFDRNNINFSFGISFESELSKYSVNLSEKACFLYTISKFLGEATKNLNDVNKFFKENFIFINFDNTTYSIEKTKEIFKQNPENNEKLKAFLSYFYTHMNIGAKGISFDVDIDPEKKILVEKMIKNNENFLKAFNETNNNRMSFSTAPYKNELIDLLMSNSNNMYLMYKVGEKEISIPIEQESEGIKKIFTLGIPLADALCNNKIIVFDELELGFHPLLSRKIVELFLNNKKSQLLFTTHNTNLLDLDLFRRDQIYFASRTINTHFMTIIKSLGEISGVRKSADIEKAYLEGKYSDAPTYKTFNNEKIGDILCPQN